MIFFFETVKGETTIVAQSIQIIVARRNAMQVSQHGDESVKGAIP
jgi:hypothetical protein